MYTHSANERRSTTKNIDLNCIHRITIQSPLTEATVKVALSRTRLRRYAETFRQGRAGWVARSKWPSFFFNFRRSLRGIVLTTPLIYLNPYSGNRRLIALRTFSAVNCPVTEKIAQIAQIFLTGHFTNEEPNSLVNPRRRPWTNLEKLFDPICHHIFGSSAQNCDDR